MIPNAIATMIRAAASAIPIALPEEIPEPLVEVWVEGATVAVWEVAGAVAPGLVSAPPSAFVVVLAGLVAEVLDAEWLDAECFFVAAWATAGSPIAGPAASTSAANAAPARRVTPRRLTVRPSVPAAQRSEARGPDIAGVSWSVLYGFSESCTSSWYTLSTFTDQMSCLAPVRMLSTARIAVSIEWSELL